MIYSGDIISHKGRAASPPKAVRHLALTCVSDSSPALHANTRTPPGRKEIKRNV